MGIRASRAASLCDLIYKYREDDATHCVYHRKHGLIGFRRDTDKAEWAIWCPGQRDVPGRYCPATPEEEAKCELARSIATRDRVG